MIATEIFPIFFVTWVVLGIGTALFYWRAGLAAKRRWHPWLIFGGGGLFIFFVAIMTRVHTLRVLLLVVPVVTLISFLNWKFTKFCPACGKTLTQNPPWSR